MEGEFVILTARLFYCAVCEHCVRNSTVLQQETSCHLGDSKLFALVERSQPLDRRLSSLHLLPEEIGLWVFQEHQLLEDPLNPIAKVTQNCFSTGFLGQSDHDPDKRGVEIRQVTQVEH
jgi:hypothetical protein